MSRTYTIILTFFLGLGKGDAACGERAVEKTHEQRLSECFEARGSNSKMLPEGPRPVEVNITVPLLSLLDYVRVQTENLLHF